MPVAARATTTTTAAGGRWLLRLPAVEEPAPAVSSAAAAGRRSRFVDACSSSRKHGVRPLRAPAEGGGGGACSSISTSSQQRAGQQERRHARRRRPAPRQHNTTPQQPNHPPPSASSPFTHASARSAKKCIYVVVARRRHDARRIIHHDRGAPPTTATAQQQRARRRRRCCCCASSLYVGSAVSGGIFPASARCCSCGRQPGPSRCFSCVCAACSPAITTIIRQRGLAASTSAPGRARRPPGSTAGHRGRAVGIKFCPGALCRGMSPVGLLLLPSLAPLAILIVLVGSTVPLSLNDVVIQILLNPCRRQPETRPESGAQRLDSRCRAAESSRDRIYSSS